MSASDPTCSPRVGPRSSPNVGALRNLAVSTHLLGLPVIELADDGRSAVVEIAAVTHPVVDMDRGPVRTRGLRHRDLFVLGDTWQISERAHHVDWMVEQPAVPLR